MRTSRYLFAIFVAMAVCFTGCQPATASPGATDHKAVHSAGLYSMTSDHAAAVTFADAPSAPALATSSATTQTTAHALKHPNRSEVAAGTGAFNPAMLAAYDLHEDEVDEGAHADDDLALLGGDDGEHLPKAA